MMGGFDEVRRRLWMRAPVARIAAEQVANVIDLNVLKGDEFSTVSSKRLVRRLSSAVAGAEGTRTAP
jgi:hypothetical protein